jgi:hypothetical protein
MEAMPEALDAHENGLVLLMAKAEQIDDALSSGQNLRKVVANLRLLRQGLAEVHSTFQVEVRFAFISPCDRILLVNIAFTPTSLIPCSGD